MNNWTTLQLQTSIIEISLKKLKSKATKEGKVFIAEATNKRFLNTFIFGGKKSQKNECRGEKCKDWKRTSQRGNKNGQEIDEKILCFVIR